MHSRSGVKGRITVSGSIYDPESGLRSGSAVIENGEITFSDQMIRNPDIEGTVIPSFVNAHTHIGDACIDAPPHGIDLAGYVRPPSGYKHMILAKTPDHMKIKSITEYLSTTFWNGITHIHDFREEGVKGIQIAKNALQATGLPLNLFLYGRPTNESPPESVLSRCDGLGISSREDVGEEMARHLSDLARARGKVFALHASEERRVEILPVLDLKPAFIVHMCHAEKEDFIPCAERGVPIVVCPRSNAVFNREPDVEGMLNAGVSVMLGTDNASVSRPDMFEEMRFLYLQKKRRIHPAEIVKMATITPRKVFKAEERFRLRDGALVLSRRFKDLESLVLKGGPEHIHTILIGGKLYRRLQP
jgi:cytosine/adenosine deaminase-related metal-dependent hydrolase